MDLSASKAHFIRLRRGATKVLFIDLKRRTCSIELHPDLIKYIGGVGLGLKLFSLYSELDPLIFSVGPLNGYFPFISKTSIVLNKDGLIEDIYLGGSLSFRIKFAGLDAIVISGVSKGPVYLDICDENVRFISPDKADIGTFGLPGKRSVLEFTRDKLLLDNFFTTPEAFLDSTFKGKNIKGIVFTGSRTFEIEEKGKYESLYKNILSRAKDLTVEKSNFPSCSGCPMGCQHSKMGETGGNILIHSLVSCCYAEKIYSDIGVVFSCVDVLGYDYTHEDLENLPHLVQNVLSELGQPSI